ncbi:hypothetical protein ACRE_013370 [Hapsidospora chrysogenum ATCC 11550]|uniref:Uncharacterized protein n=1 Tax=Hapsidospora chrysogenum (strain ATCC 11550 / CBS 779.69 / DSM 880 / IAM 14645 / JCM 23072 / IMI 49137) TaxID=857340 RepID=A0A086TEE3_HAPC1|nr:hypothetical protein ACRE_013370 [Hapsidospora chrysogenum ATCC 11550]
MDRFRHYSVAPTAYQETGQEDSVHFVHCTLDEGDTRVFVDAPKINTDPRRRTNCDGVVPSSQSFLVHSTKLLALEGSKFAQLLNNEIYQARVRRRRKPSEQMMEGVRYLLDLTPPSEGDELVFQMTELSLTPGILKWWNAHLIHGIRPELVKGHDDVCSCRHGEQEGNLGSEERKKSQPVNVVDGSIFEPRGADQENENASTGAVATPATAQASVEAAEEDGHNLISLPASPAQLIRLRALGRNETYKTPSHYQIPDYCPFRHFCSIIRLLMMIEGKAVHLNSAARVWTMVGISKIFECPSVVRDQVAQWILSHPVFIEVLPEESLSIGFTLELPQVTRPAFRILVTELALEEAGDGKRAGNRHLTIFGRRLGEVGDEKYNLVQHAARALIERLTSQLKMLLNPDLLDFWELKEWKKLRQIESLLVAEDIDGAFVRALAQVRLLMAALVHKVTAIMESAFETKLSRVSWSHADRARATYVAPKDFEQMMFIIPRLNRTQLLLLTFFYSELEDRVYTNVLQSGRSDHPGSRGQYFSHMIRDLETELQVLADAHPARAYRDSWQFLLLSDAERGSTPQTPLSWDLRRTLPRPLIRLDILEDELLDRIRPIILSRVWVDPWGFEPPLKITEHLLLTLTSNEMKFLPLWAGGNDDGTGGVFEQFLPPAEMGPSGPGPSYRTGMTLPSVPPSLSGSLMDEITAMKIQGSTTAGSVDVHNSISTGHCPDRVVALDSSVPTESFAEDDSDYNAARFQEPADHQAAGQSLAMLVDSPAAGDSDSDATEIGPYASDGGESDQEMSEDDKGATTSDSDASSMVLV